MKNLILIVLFLTSPFCFAGKYKCKKDLEAFKKNHSSAIVIDSYKNKFWYYSPQGAKYTTKDLELLENLYESCLGYKFLKGKGKNGKPLMECGPDYEAGTGIIKTFCIPLMVI
jgi:hypothetical protein